MNDEFHKNLTSVNVMRALEIVQIMKPSQSVTERVMSYLSNAVHHRFESKILFQTGSSESDPVN